MFLSTVLLEKRCRVVPSKITDDGKIEFDENIFIELLQMKPEKPNDEFINEYMIPDFI